ncbi:hypothetical protein EPIR_3809 [Erwinia piriflorinigrans CFBP 5888]|uniref:Uncharacterized protein n=1 Tax=Erwinia piriflorinigrans CFBP 5888 TaxID=1161919 RepID=V5ZDE3_9GAMM|nr:hypothetical protein EPIR_3809 [Erwinia piriflorinigrans CFBP 5888]
MILATLYAQGMSRVAEKKSPIAAVQAFRKKAVRKKIK